MNQAEETLNDYKQRLTRQTSELAERVSYYYRDLPYGTTQQAHQQLQQTVEEYNWELRKKAQELEEIRDEERREFYRKIDG